MNAEFAILSLALVTMLVLVLSCIGWFGGLRDLAAQSNQAVKSHD